MTDRPLPPGIDTSVAHVARVYDYMLGGSTNYEVDRRAAEMAARAHVGGLDTLRFSTRSNRAFLGRAVRYLATEAGIDQYLDIGAGLPTEQNVHQVAQRHAPSSSIVYVDNDPTVLSHASYLLESNAEGATGYINGDLREPRHVLLRAETTLDLTKPVAVLLFTILHNILDEDDPWATVREFMAAVPSGSYLAISHLTADVNPEEMSRGKEVLDREMREPFILRSHAEIARFFEGTELVEPGLVPINEWRPDGNLPVAPEGAMPPPIFGGVGRKP